MTVVWKRKAVPHFLFPSCPHVSMFQNGTMGYISTGTSSRKPLGTKMADFPELFPLQLDDTEVVKQEYDLRLDDLLPFFRELIPDYDKQIREETPNAYTGIYFQ